MKITELFKKKKVTELPFGINNEYSHITEALKGKIDFVKTSHYKKYGVEHPYNFEVCSGVYDQFGMISGAIDKLVDFVWGSGMRLESKNKRAIKILEDWIRDTGFENIGREWVKEAFKTGNSYLELSGKLNEVPQEIQVLPSKSVYIDAEDTGRIKGFNLVVDKNKKPISFKPYEIALLRINKSPEDAYGKGLIYPALKKIDDLIGLDANMHLIMRRKAHSPLVATLGNKEQGEYPTSSVVQDFGSKMQVMNNRTEWAVSADVALSTIDFGNVGEKFEIPLNHDLDMLFFTLQIPEVLMGRGNIPEGLADRQVEMFRNGRVKALQDEIEKVIEQKIFKRVLLANGMDEHVEVEWGEPDNTERNKRIEVITNLLSNFLIGENFRRELEKELAILLGVDPDVIDEDSEQREKEREEVQPIVPGQNEKQHVMLGAEYDLPGKVKDLSEAFELKEWLGFNYEKYVNDILEFIEKHNFPELSANNAFDVQLGKLSEKQVSRLKLVLKDAFKNGKSINQIADDLVEVVKIKDLKVLDKDGKFKFTLPSDVRKYLIARTETTRTANGGAQLNYRKNNVQEYRWLSSIDNRTSDICSNLNGQVFPIGRGPLPPAHVNCRSTIVPVTELDK